MKILSFDQGSSISGWAILEDGVLIASGIIDLHKEKVIETRIQHMAYELKKIILEAHPDRIAFEDIALQDSAKVVIWLGRLQGYMQMLCWEYQIPFSIYLPTSWRKTIGISPVKLNEDGKKVRKKRKELKADACQVVFDKYGMSVSDDIADAILIGLCDYIKNNELKENEDNGTDNECDN